MQVIEVVMGIIGTAVVLAGAGYAMGYGVARGVKRGWYGDGGEEHHGHFRA